MHYTFMDLDKDFQMSFMKAAPGQCLTPHKMSIYSPGDKAEGDPGKAVGPHKLGRGREYKYTTQESFGESVCLQGKSLKMIFRIHLKQASFCHTKDIIGRNS